ncbi:sugar phosphate nucleotidyltransferase [Rosenbergiella australiborealis]|uniref:sugar phosphate nucleotidyltransferase n=1 Tax=Rosenbergiella australiborealis TaxID=1544696 RepID=UPI001F4DBD90|nr:sugar phosphate nucleotidyltransferase [Rosenbergiella australiborealis]
MLTIITPMVGEDLYQTSSENSFPKILNEIDGKTIFEYSQCYLKSIEDNYNKIYIRPNFSNQQYMIDNIIQRIVGEDAILINVNNNTAGALCTCLLAAEYWDDDDELIITSADQYLDINCQSVINEFRESNTDIGLISFSSVHPKWSYIKRDDSNSIIEVVEKKAISDEAMASFFYFNKASLFFKLAKSSLLKSRSTNNIFYLSACVNEAILDGGVVSAKIIENKEYYNFYDFNAINRFS